MNWKRFSLPLLLLLSACDDSSSTSPQVQSSGTFDTAPQASVVSATSPVSTTPWYADRSPADTVSVQTPEPAKPDAAAIARQTAEVLKAQGLITRAGAVLADAGLEDEAFPLLAPEDHKVDDKTAYLSTAAAGLALETVDETPSSKRQMMKIGGKDVNFITRAGHLIAYAPKDPKDSNKKDAEAAIFYTYYARDGLPKDKRPVTFFFNGGPGSAAIWLQLGSWAPKRLKTDAPNIPPEFRATRPESFPLIDNDETLLDQSDLVFVNPPGTSLSEAILPHTNTDFWDMDRDAEVNNDFITRFINYYNRQSSPKYIYGESYSGIRVPIMAAKLEAAGTANYEPDPSGKPPIVLSGLVLHSPILNYQSSCGMSSGVSCNGNLPTYAMTVDYYGKSQRGNRSIPAFLDDVRAFGNDEYDAHFPIFPKNTDLYGSMRAAAAKLLDPEFEAPKELQALVSLLKVLAMFSDDNYIVQYLVDLRKVPVPAEWSAFVPTNIGVAFLHDLSIWTGISTDFLSVTPNLGLHDFILNFLPGEAVNVYDSRMALPGDGDKKIPYDISFYEDTAFANAIMPHLADFANYTSVTEYKAITAGINIAWKYQRDPSVKYWKSSIVDLQTAIRDGDGLKIAVVGGYTDMVTPFHQTELDLAEAGLTERVPVKWFDGGHMTYLTEASRAPLKATLDEFYQAPPVADGLNAPQSVAATEALTPPLAGAASSAVTFN